MLTSSQQRALDTSRHLSVTANAGSGKTMVLVERYINILTSGKAYVNEVVALTFTDKAASELKRKIADSVSKKIIETTDDRLKNKLEEIREQLSGAVIGTIHWFCAKVLREYPVEAGVDAAFTVLEVVDQQVMLEKAIKETFDSILKATQESERREQLFDVLRALGKNKVMDIVHALALKRDQVGRLILPGGIYTRDDADVLATWRSHLTEFVKSEFDDPVLMSDVQTLVEGARGSAELTVRASFKVFKRTTDFNERLQRFVELMEKMLTRDGDLRKKVFAGNSLHLADAADRLRTKYKALGPLIRFVTEENVEAHRSLLRQSRILLEIYQHVIERFEDMKMEGAYLDFDDLQIRTKNLLENAKVRHKLSQRYKYIMVDEYQDTNKLQYEILLPLVSNLSGAAPARAVEPSTGRQGNLFIVGDPKQSIYGFRDANVAVFNQTKNDIEQKSGSESTIVLSDSFRLLRDIVAFVNLIFSPLMKAAGGEHEIAYESLVQGRQNNATGRIELIIRDASEGEGEQPSEGQLIARRILQLRAKKHQIFSKEETSRDVQFSDFAILLRSRTGLADLEEAFIHSNVPYLISGGVGYFQTQGIYDFYNYFRFLLNTDDDVALVGILRSPFFNVSDAELYEMSLDRKAPGLWKELKRKGGKVKRFASLVRAVDILTEDIAVASRLSVPDLVNRIVEETAYAGFVAGTARSEQTFANLEKLKRVARSYASHGFTNLYDFVGRLKRLTEQEEQEGQAAVDVLADAVKVMTIHSAKGLEFPIVIIPGLERTFQYDREPFLDDELGIGFTPLSNDDDEGNVPIADFLKRKSRALTIAEEKRVFYVACTRARDMLILSGLQSRNRSSNNFMNWLLDGLQVGEISEQPSLTFDVVTERLSVEDEQFKPLIQQHQLNIHVFKSGDIKENRSFEFSPATQSMKSRLLIDPIKPNAHGEVFSASKIRTYIECPSKYYLRYVAGLPSASIKLSNDPIDDEQDIQIPADLRGRAFHYIMQHIDTIGNDRNTILAELKKFIARDSYSILSEPSIELEALTQSVVDVLGSRFWNDVKNGTGSQAEFTIMSTLGDDFLTGTLDRVYRDRHGVWNVLDYKTDAVTQESLQQKIEHYEPQVRFYALLVRKYFSTEKVQANLLFSSLVDKPVQFKYASNELIKFENDLSSTIAKVHSGIFHRDGKPCMGCPFMPKGCSALIN